MIFFLKFNLIERNLKKVLEIKEIKKYLSFLFIDNKLSGSYITKSNEFYSNISYQYKETPNKRINKIAPTEITDNSTNKFSGSLYQKIIEARYNKLEKLNQT